MMEQGFTIRITGTENFTWQGILVTPNETLSFRSELELLKGMDRLLPPEFSVFRAKGPRAVPVWEGGPYVDR